MNDVNSRLSVSVSYPVATLVIHVVGLAAVSVALLVRREADGRGRLPLYYYLGGFVGVGTVFSSTYSFAALGASLAVALALLGQTLFSVAVDATGFLGRTRYPFRARSLPGLALACAGVAIMAGGWRMDAPAMIVALVSGILPGLTFLLNSELGRRRGLLHSTRINYVVGLATTIVIVAALRPPIAPAVTAVKAAGPLLALGGGCMGVAVVTAMNFLYPRIPAFSATLLVFSGQALTGVLIDAVAEGALDVRKLVGTFVLLVGFSVNALLARRGAVACARGAANR